MTNLELFFITIITVECSCVSLAPSSVIVNIKFANFIADVTWQSKTLLLSKKTKTLIVNGFDAPKRPFYARLLNHFDNWTEFCGSTIINDRFLLTAAHCVYPPTSAVKRFIVEVGVNYKAISPENSGFHARMRRIFIHPDFYINPGIYFNFLEK